MKFVSFALLVVASAFERMNDYDVKDPLHQVSPNFLQDKIIELD